MFTFAKELAVLFCKAVATLVAAISYNSRFNHTKSEKTLQLDSGKAQLCCVHAAKIEKQHVWETFYARGGCL